MNLAPLWGGGQVNDKAGNSWAITGNASVIRDNRFGYILRCPTRYSGRIYTIEPLNKVIGTQDFTIELWFKPLGQNNDKGLFVLNDNLGSTVANLGIVGSSSAFYGGSYYFFNNLETVGLWRHYALVRHNNILTQFFNGKKIQPSIRQDSSNYAYRYATIGYYGEGGGVDGDIARPRLIIGEALYLDDFTPKIQEVKYLILTQDNKVYNVGDL